MGKTKLNISESVKTTSEIYLPDFFIIYSNQKKMKYREKLSTITWNKETREYF